MPVTCGIIHQRQQSHARKQYSIETEMIMRYLPNSQSLRIAPTIGKAYTATMKLCCHLIGHILVERR